MKLYCKVGNITIQRLERSFATKKKLTTLYNRIYLQSFKQGKNNEINQKLTSRMMIHKITPSVDNN